MKLWSLTGLRFHLALVIGRSDIGETLFSFFSYHRGYTKFGLAGRFSWVGFWIDSTRIFSSISGYFFVFFFDIGSFIGFFSLMGVFNLIQCVVSCGGS